MQREQDYSFISRRSPVISLNSAVASSQPIATEIGQRILRQGGNAADAAVGVAAALNLVEPMSTGVGGDVFVLFYKAEDKKVYGINGSGCCPSNLTLEKAKKACGNNSKEDCLPINSVHTVTVPGAAAAWVDTVELFGSGKLSLSELFEPTITIAEQGYAVHPICSYLWQHAESTLSQWTKSSSHDLLLNGRAPKPGEVMKNPAFAATLKDLGEHGKKGFYSGRVAKAIVDVIAKNDGLLNLEDLERHRSSFDDPISVVYNGIRIWEIPPNGQGITALVALNILKQFDLKGMKHNSADYLHVLIEALQLAFSDSLIHVADPAVVDVPVQKLLSEEYGKERSRLISAEKALEHYPCGVRSGSDTVYFTVVDDQGNACSFINSIFDPFGCGLVPDGCGFALSNRGNLFSLSPDHANVLAPNKRPYHTIIPGMATYESTNELYCSFGVMGGFMQPQGHVQVLSNLINFGMDPQEALNKPRFCIDVQGDRGVNMEDGIEQEVMVNLKQRGHRCSGPLRKAERRMFGLGQIIQRRNFNDSTSVLWSGSDPRGDGCAIGY